MDILNAGQSLGVNQQLQSSNNQYNLVMQGDGNLVLYAGSTAVWATNTWTLPAAFRPTRATMQGDGNFVLYSAAGNPAWASGTHMYPGSRLILQNDRNLVIYDPNNTPRWASNTWIATPTPTAPVQATKNEEVGWGKRMNTQTTLYRDGRLFVSCYTKNDNWTGALRGKILVVPVDAAGRSLWVSSEFRCTTRCSVPDFSCASYGKDTFFEQFPAAVGQHATRLDIYQADTPSFVDLRNKLIDFVKSLGDVAQAVKDEWGKLLKT